MSSFPLVHINLGLESLDLLCLNLEQFLDLEFLFHDVPLLFIILVHKDSLVGVVQLLI